MKKITKREKFEAIITAMETGDCPVTPDVIIEFCNAEIAALDKKSAKAKERAAEKRAEGDTLTAIVKDALTDECEVIADIAAKVAAVAGEDATLHKVQYRLGQLAKNGDAVSTDVKVPGGDGQKTRTIKAYKLAD